MGETVDVIIWETKSPQSLGSSLIWTTWAFVSSILSETQEELGVAVSRGPSLGERWVHLAGTSPV